MTEIVHSGSGNRGENPSKRESDPPAPDQTAKRPKTDSAVVVTKKSAEEKAKEVIFDIVAGSAEDRGSRTTMEDRSVVVVNSNASPTKLRRAHFAIYDGHGGTFAVDHAQKYLHANVLASGLPLDSIDVKAAKKAIHDGFQRTNETIHEESIAGGWQDGATAVCLWILGQTAFVANIGDAKAVLARSSASDGGSPLKGITLTREHKAFYSQERARIQKAGGVMTCDGRLQGRLEVSRAFGDHQFKQYGLIATPDVTCFDITEREQFIILGCDGLWKVFGPGDAVEFVGKLLKEGLSATVAARRLVREAIHERRCQDNCTAVVVIFKHKLCEATSQ